MCFNNVHIHAYRIYMHMYLYDAQFFCFAGIGIDVNNCIWKLFEKYLVTTVDLYKNNL